LKEKVLDMAMYCSFIYKDISSQANKLHLPANIMEELMLRCTSKLGANLYKTPAFALLSRHNRAFRQILFWSQYQHETPQ
jgi:hypothetical protein